MSATDGLYKIILASKSTQKYQEICIANWSISRYGGRQYKNGNDAETSRVSWPWFRYFENAITCSIEYLYVDVIVRENI